MISYITININPVLVHIGPIAVHWYGIMYAIAFTAGYYWGVLPHALPRGLDRHYCEKLLFTTIVVGLIGARLYYVIQQPDLGYYARNPLEIIAVWNGGMAFFGAIIGGAVVFAYRAWRDHTNFWLLFDTAALFAVVGQPIGRIGNIINGDILGSQSTLPWATAYTNPNAVLQSCCHLGVPYQPAALYEALGTLLIGAFLILIRRRGVRPGVLCITYLGGYAISQFVLFFLRNSEPVIGLGLKQAQWTALVTLLIAVPLLVVIWHKTGAKTAPACETEPA